MPNTDTREILLIVEDDDAKYSDIAAVLVDFVPARYRTLLRAATVTSAEQALDEELPGLLVLDVSMNISPGSLGPMRGGFANLGGLDIAERLYLRGQSVKAVLITSFDYFQARGQIMGTSKGQFDMVSLADISTRARELLGDGYLGCIRYGGESWREELVATVAEAAA